jgi:hypothetical protein
MFFITFFALLVRFCVVSSVNAIDPPYTLIGSLNFLSLIPLLRAYNSQSSPTAWDYFQAETIYVPMIVSLIQIVLFSALIYYIDFVRYYKQSKESSQVENATQTLGSCLNKKRVNVFSDQDVLAERRLVDELVTRNKDPGDILIIDHLRKVYTTSVGILWHRKTKKHVAVQDICVRVKKGECFGIFLILKIFSVLRPIGT